MKGDDRDLPEIDATLSIAHQVRRDFDLVSDVRAGDEALIARAVDRVLVGRPPAARRRADRRVAAVLGLAVVLFASGAAAWWAVRSAVRSAAPPPGDEPTPAARALRSRHAGPHATAPPAVALPPPETAVPVAAPDLEPAPARDATLALAPPVAPARGARLALAPAADRTGAPAPAPTSPSRRGSDSAPPAAAAPALAPTQPPAVEAAAELFGRANDARRAGDVGVARALYRDVAERFPGSAEAGLARVSLGKLLLGAGEVRAAEAEFARYLAAGGPLVQEALVGRAECLRRLGRSDDERRVWQRLVDEFPGGVYESQARSRLAELGPVDSTLPTPTP
ncbi:MAG TPA: tetratricopeptide repeat protein [Polyangia bacterium]|nr:tetratricopeptide repeat protein [Polyangia bacterium]